MKHKLCIVFGLILLKTLSEVSLFKHKYIGWKYSSNKCNYAKKKTFVIKLINRILKSWSKTDWSAGDSLDLHNYTTNNSETSLINILPAIRTVPQIFTFSVWYNYTEKDKPQTSGGSFRKPSQFQGWIYTALVVLY